MGREVMRVPKGFPWPVGVTWFGFVLDAVPCELCHATGKRPQGPTQRRDKPNGQLWDCTECELCEGEGKVWPRIELPIGEAYQMWETTSEGSPISPPCDTPEDLAAWLADNKASTFGRATATYEQWLAMINECMCPSMAVSTEHGPESGVELIAREAAAP